MDSTLGFTALDGLCMGTRPGSVDPGVILHLFQTMGRSAAEVEKLLYKQSGLLGISGISNDMRDLLDNPDPAARLAVDYFVYQAAKQHRRARRRAAAESMRWSSPPGSASAPPRSGGGSARHPRGSA